MRRVKCVTEGGQNIKADHIYHYCDVGAANVWISNIYLIHKLYFIS